jgi:outer membrane protein OmpA-like peptidoglycan-associated protein
LTRYLNAALAGVLVAGGLSIAACAPFASQGDIAEHEASIRQNMNEADAATNERVAAVNQAAQAAMTRANQAHEAAQHPFEYKVLMQDDSVKFDSNKSDLSPEAQTFLTDFAQKLKSQNQNVYIEIQGHGDTHGSPALNMKLGERRADAVKRFLNTQGVPLARMNTVSYGEENPKAEETTPESHAENRRVVLIVLGG